MIFTIRINNHKKNVTLSTKQDIINKNYVGDKIEYSYSLVHTLLAAGCTIYSHNAHRQTDRQTGV